MNIIQIINELCISIAYTFCALFYWDVDIETETHVWIILSCVGMSYLLHLSVIFYNLIRTIIQKIQDYIRRRRDKTKAEES